MVCARRLVLCMALAATLLAVAFAQDPIADTKLPSSLAHTTSLQEVAAATSSSTDAGAAEPGRHLLRWGHGYRRAYAQADYLYWAVRGLKAVETKNDDSSVDSTLLDQTQPEASTANRRLLRWGHRKAHSQAHRIYRSVRGLKASESTEEVKTINTWGVVRRMLAEYWHRHQEYAKAHNLYYYGPNAVNGGQP